MRGILQEMPKKLPGEERCTGCGACASSCPANAIRLGENEDGFLMPSVDKTMCLDCGRCTAVCPALAPASGNLVSPGIYAFRAKDAIRDKSASGGFFPVMARMILDMGGVVCGCAYDAEWNARHVIADTWEGIQPMRSSKYMQSSLGDCYTKLKDILKSGRQVLFTGTPCQVAGLKSFLGRDYENLLTLDLVCEGVAPQKLFQEHLREIDFPGPYASIDFRSKRYPWGSHVLRIEARDGRVYEGRDPHDCYQHGLLGGLILRKSCGDCPFCDYPRQGDITMGDFWGYESIMGHKPDSRGTSMLFVNNAKGQDFFSRLPKDNEILRVDWNPRKLPNRVYPVPRKRPGRDRLFDLLKTMPLRQAMDYLENRKFDAACIGGYQNYNFGGSLTYFALFHVLEDLGLRTMMIGPPSDSRNALPSVRNYYEPRSWPEYVFPGEIADKMAMREINQRCDIFVTGSDQYFNTTCYQWTEGCVIQDWVEDTKNKIAYAASFGHDRLLELPASMREDMAFFMQKFDAFSVREDSGVRICADEFGINATHVLDPVLLCDRRHYQRLAALSSEPNPETARFIYAYMVDPAGEKLDMIEDFSKLKRLDYRFYSEWWTEDKFSLPLSRGRFNKRLLDLMDSSFVLTDSFHGVTFSIIFRKPFIAFANPERGYTRFTSFLGELGLKKRIVNSRDEYQGRKDELCQPVDYDSVWNRLQPRIDFSLNWLKNAVSTKQKKTLSEYDASMRKMREVEKKLADRCSQLEAALAEKDKKLEKLMQAQEELLKRIEQKSQ